MSMWSAFYVFYLGPTGGSSGNSFGPGNDMNTLCNMDAGMMSMGRGGPMLGPDGNPVPGPGGPMGGMDGMGPMGPGGPNNMGMIRGPSGGFGPMMGPNGPMGGPNAPMGMDGPGGPMGPGMMQSKLNTYCIYISFLCSKT